MQEMRGINRAVAQFIRNNKKPAETLYAVTAHQLLEVIKTRAREIGKVKKGTYNHADPTAFENIACYVHFDGDPYLLKEWKHAPTPDDECPPEMYEQAPPPSSLYTLELEDCTWGTDVTLRIVDAELEDAELQTALVDKDKKAVHFYLDHQNGNVIQRGEVEEWDAYDLMMRLLLGDGEMRSDKFRFDKDMSDEEIQQREAQHADMYRHF